MSLGSSNACWLIIRELYKTAYGVVETRTLREDEVEIWVSSSTRFNILCVQEPGGVRLIIRVYTRKYTDFGGVYDDLAYENQLRDLRRISAFIDELAAFIKACSISMKMRRRFIDRTY